MTHPSPQVFNAFESTLSPGINLIEASAGTGKTYSIVMLVLRFLLEHGYTLEQLLIVTFTKAAAQELRDRVRSRLLEVKAILAGNSSNDAELDAWVANLADSDLTRCRLMDALADSDHANIFTIHGFCQRTLTQFALESGQVFGSELLENVSHIEQQIAQDYWRIETYARSLTQVVLIRSVATTPDSLLAAIRNIRDGSEILPPEVSLQQCLQELEAQLDLIQKVFSDVLTGIKTAIAEQPDHFKVKFKEDFANSVNKLQSWLAGKRPVPLQAITSLTEENFLNKALNNRKFMARPAQGLTAEQRKNDFLQEYGIELSTLEPLAEQLTTLQIALKQGLYNYLKTELENRLTHSNQLSFNSMISHLANALSGEQGTHLKQLLQNKYPVALIDEFQDTDDTQWSIFSTLVEPPANNHFLYLIGDPKQAIYRFRGADIYSYLQAKKQADQEYSLEKNWRSQAPLVSATNTLFAIDKPFLIEDIRYYPVKAGLSEPGLTKSGKCFEQMVLWELEKNPQQKDGYWFTNNGNPKAQIRTHVVKEILQLLDPSNAIILDNRALKPSDIAILVRSHKEAEAYQQALTEHGVPAVLNSKASVFESRQAIEIYHLLHAITRPGNPQLLRYALSLPWFGMNGNDLYDLQDNQQQMDQWLIDFQRYHELWERKGLLAMMHTLMDDHQVALHLQQNNQLERQLTNINHILEMMQEVAVNQRLTMSQTLEWLSDTMQQRIIPGGQELRLESDDNALEIVTIHASKGLEYGIVFCPDLWSYRKPNKSDIVVFHQNGKHYSDLGSDALEQHRELSQTESQAEDLRLLYVAITRAKYRCYLAWANLRTAKTENDSALAHVYQQQPGESWGERMQSLLKQTGDCANNPFHYSSLEVEAEVKGYYQRTEQPNLTANREITAERIQQDWMMSSYSGLAYHSVHDVEIPELPLDKSGEIETVSDTGQQHEESEELPRGAQTGNLVHELLEHIPFAVLADPQKNDDYIAKRDELIKRFGVAIENKALLDQLLINTVTTPIDVPDDKNPPFILANLPEAHCLKEMPFYFAVKHLDSHKINAVLAQCESCLPLSEQQMRGQLTGFIDLICKFGGRYYVMDYKTNSLPDYSIASMTSAMREHNYGLQYWIYTLVLHRHLQQSLPDYDFNKHFGGVRYLFVRGMQADKPASGVYQDQPDYAMLQAFAQAFTGEVTA